MQRSETFLERGASGSQRFPAVEFTEALEMVKLCDGFNIVAVEAPRKFLICFPRNRNGIMMRFLGLNS